MRLNKWDKVVLGMLLSIIAFNGLDLVLTYTQAQGQSGMSQRCQDLEASGQITQKERIECAVYGDLQSESQSQSETGQDFQPQQQQQPEEFATNETGTGIETEDETVQTQTQSEPLENEGLLVVDIYGTSNSSNYYVCGGPMVTIRNECLSMTGGQLREEWGEFIYPLREENELFGCAIDQATWQYACDSVTSSEFETEEKITLTMLDPSPIRIPFEISEIQEVIETDFTPSSNTTATEPEMAPQVIP